jgi:hypothetical protein
MKASFSSTPKIKTLSPVDERYFIGLLIFTAIAISSSYLLRSRFQREKNKNE